MTVINKAGVDLIKEFEGCRLTSYRCPAGRWTIGYGLTTGALPGVAVGAGMTITQAQADDYLQQTLAVFWNGIARGFTRNPTPNQKAALLSLAYNIGPGAFLKSTALKRHNAGNTAGAAAALQWFNKAGGRVLTGLVRRRAAEAKLYLTADTAPVAPPAVEVPDIPGLFAAIARLLASTFGRK